MYRYVPILHLLSRGASGSGRNAEAAHNSYVHFNGTVVKEHAWASATRTINNRLAGCELLDHFNYSKSCRYLSAAIEFIACASTENQSPDTVDVLFKVYIHHLHYE